MQGCGCARAGTDHELAKENNRNSTNSFMVVVHNLDRSDAYMHGFEREKEGFARGAHEGLEFVGRAVGEAVKTAWGPTDRRCP